MTFVSERSQVQVSVLIQLWQIYSDFYRSVAIADQPQIKRTPCLSAFFQICRPLVFLSLEATILCDFCQSYVHTRTHTYMYFLLFRTALESFANPFYEMDGSKLSTVLYLRHGKLSLFKYSRRCVSSCTVQYGICTINVLHKVLAFLIGTELTSVLLYQKAFCHMTEDHFMVSFRS